IKEDALIENKDNIHCYICNLPLVPRKVHITYMGTTFTTRILGCPVCGEIYLPEDLALGKAVEVEMALEEK
ncbi:MAG: hypothetical protein RR396_07200, partial [Clostridiales bacterium]